jgi:hypothetical protein
VLVYVGSETKIDSVVAACPPPERVSWQKSRDSVTFEPINMDNPKYYGSQGDPSNPILIFRKVTFDDRLYYRLLVWNKIGQSISNTVYLKVTGGMYGFISVCKLSKAMYAYMTFIKMQAKYLRFCSKVLFLLLDNLHAQR